MKKRIAPFLLLLCIAIMPVRVFADGTDLYNEIKDIDLDELRIELQDSENWELIFCEKQLEDYLNSENVGEESEKVRKVIDIIESVLDERDVFTEEDTDLEPEWEELDPFSNPYYTAILNSMNYMQSSFDEEDFKLNAIYYYVEDNNEPGSTGVYSEGWTEWFLYDYYYSNEENEIVEGQKLEHINRGGPYIASGYVFVDSPDLQEENPSIWNLYLDLKNGEIGEALNTQFIEYILSLN